jgi:predicted acetyltransferase
VTEPSVSLEPAGPQDAPVLANLLELYAHDLSDAFGLAIGADGRFGYAKLPRYFSEPDHFPFLIRTGGALAGFALVTRGSPLGAPGDLDVAEFFVLRRHRRAGVGRRAAARLWDAMPGHWIVRVADCNQAALPFWSGAIAAYTGQRFTREERPAGGRVWTRFAFDVLDSPGLIRGAEP